MGLTPSQRAPASTELTAAATFDSQTPTATQATPHNETPQERHERYLDGLRKEQCEWEERQRQERLRPSLHTSRFGDERSPLAYVPPRSVMRAPADADGVGFTVPSWGNMQMPGMWSPAPPCTTGGVLHELHLEVLRQRHVQRLCTRAEREKSRQFGQLNEASGRAGPRTFNRQKRTPRSCR